MLEGEEGKRGGAAWGILRSLDQSLTWTCRGQASLNTWGQPCWGGVVGWKSSSERVWRLSGPTGSSPDWGVTLGWGPGASRSDEILEGEAHKRASRGQLERTLKSLQGGLLVSARRAGEWSTVGRTGKPRLRELGGCS